MAERANKRLRRLSTEDSEGADDWTPEDGLLDSRGTSSRYRQEAPPPRSATNRPRRAAAPTSAALIQRSPSPENTGKRTLRLTVKAPPNKLREAVGGSAAASVRDSLSRSSKNKKAIVESSDEEDDELSDVEDVEPDEEDEEEEADEDDEDRDGEGDEDEEMMDEEDEQEDDEEAEEDDEDAEDVYMQDAPPAVKPPQIKISAPNGSRKLSPGRTLKLPGAKIQSVEEKEIETPVLSDLDSQDELSDLDSQDGGDDDEEDGAEADEDNDIIAANTIEEHELDSDADSSLLDSRGGTPDLSKLTRRQRAHLDEPGGTLIALSNEAAKKKIFTPEEVTMRRAEMARRRKDLSDKRNAEEKADTLKKLLSKPTPKRRSRLQMQQAAEDEAMGTPRSQEMDSFRPSALYVRTVINGDGTRIGVPTEWAGTVAGKVFEDAQAPAHPSTASGWGHGRLIEVMEETSTPEIEGRA